MPLGAMLALIRIMPDGLRERVCPDGRAWRAAALAALVALVAMAPILAAPDPLAEGKAAYARGDYLRAVQQLLPLAQAGNAEAQVRVGIMYFMGLGVAEDDAAAFDWFQRSALQGNAEAQYHLGNMYTFGHGVPAEVTDPDRMAAKWYFESAQQDNADAQYSLGILFFSGKGVVQDPEEAAKWFRRAANNGHADAQRFIGAIAAPR